MYPYSCVTFPSLPYLALRSFIFSSAILLVCVYGYIQYTAISTAGASVFSDFAPSQI